MPTPTHLPTKKPEPMQKPGGNGPDRNNLNADATRNLTYGAIAIALVFLATRFTYIPAPVPPGYINFGDTVIFLTAVLIGWKGALVAGALGSMLADVSLGAFLYAPITLVVKGLEGWLAGVVMKRTGMKKPGIALGMLAGALLMITGYFLAETILLGFFDETFGLAAALSNLPANLVQGAVSVIAGWLIHIPLVKIIHRIPR
jgi:uncharacterized membrane protein